MVALPLPPGSPDGLLYSADDRDFIVIEQRLAPIHQRQVALHEIGHFICDHEAAPVMTPEASRLLLPGLDPTLVHRVLGRDHSQSAAEREAEYIGSIIGQCISAWAEPRTWPVPQEAQELVARLTALEHPHTKGPR
ncbi:ImmA/IrrE family metallo-endopeptidase [Streptomyces sp. NPDC095613]|uniref:ImmA/IrrE family metallo-endopeptidase n=1 Tax=Streptomyces sp. NPDC095613 TaxID=3155540 RepID=UPI003317158A